MSLKEGDKVRITGIREGTATEYDHPGWVAYAMSPFVGLTAQVIRVIEDDSDGSVIVLDGVDDLNEWLWHPSWLEKV